MHLCFDEAVEIGMKAYRRLEYSNSCVSAFKIASRELKKYLEKLNLQYSFEISQQWINDSKKNWEVHKFKSSRKTIQVIADIMQHGFVTNSLRTKTKRIPPYTQLPNWSRTLVDNYLLTLPYTYEAYLIYIRNACSRFLLFLECKGIRHSFEITHGVVKLFFAEDTHVSSKGKDKYNSQIRRFLIYMADQELIQKTIGLALNKFVIPDLIIVTELPEPERNKFLKFSDTFKNEIFCSWEEFDVAARRLVDIHKNRKYSPTIRKSTSKAIIDFKIFMDANSFAYSNELALEWLEYKRIKWSIGKYLTFRRVLLSINEILCKGTLSTSSFSTRKSKYILPEWGNNLLLQYLKEREYEGCTSSTLAMIHCACSRFIVFVNNQGVENEKGITHKIIKEFQAQDNHLTVKGKNAYAIKIRGFLRFLARERIVPKTLELAVSTEMAPRTSIVTILSNNQIDAIYTFRRNANRPIELRNAAIILLGLKMGLRASDIANLKLTDISWKDNSISFTQQKTGVFLRLPLPVDAGNSLYHYLCEGRPKSNSPNVFIHHRAPYCGFGKGNFGVLLKPVVAAHCDSDIHGFHVTRKTFASNLLSNGNPVTTIAAALGHLNEDAVDEYLATNEDTMRLCAIGLKGIEYSGGFCL